MLAVLLIVLLIHVRIHLLLANSIGSDAKYHNIPVKIMFYLF